MNYRTTLLTVGIAACLIGWIATAGPLDPPVGAVSSTFKTLQEIEPRVVVNSANTPGGPNSVYRITLPGSYYLDGIVHGVAGKHGIEIVASGVTLDLNGFEVVGVGGEPQRDGVIASAAGLSRISVHNGVVRNWSGVGVNLGSAEVRSCRVTGVTAEDNGVHGIYAGYSGVVSSCAVRGNGDYGILSRDGGTVTECTAQGNRVGIGGESACHISDCAAKDNSFTGVSLNVGGVISRCISRSNGGNGLSVHLGGLVTDCSASDNAVDGILASGGSVVRGNVCFENGRGGTGAGVRVTVGGNRVEGNSCTGGASGIVVESSGNVVIGNTCSSNGVNWSLAAGNSYGPIVRSGVGAAGFVGDGNAASSMASTDPHANFSY